MSLFFFISITPDWISNEASLLLWISRFSDSESKLPFNLIEPFLSVETIGAWLFKIWNDPSVPGTWTDVTSPVNKVLKKAV